MSRSVCPKHELGYDKDNVIIIPKEGAVGEKKKVPGGNSVLDGVAGASASGHDMTVTTGVRTESSGLERSGRPPRNSNVSQ